MRVMLVDGGHAETDELKGFSAQSHLGPRR